MSMSTISQASVIIRNNSVLDYIGRYPSPAGHEAELAYHKNKKGAIILAILVTLIMCISLVVLITLSFAKPTGTYKDIYGHVEDGRFWYSGQDGSRTYGNLDDFFDDTSKLHNGQPLYVYVDKDYEVLGVRTTAMSTGLLLSYIIFVALIPIGLIIGYIVIASRTFAKAWFDYSKWYSIAVEPDNCYKEVAYFNVKEKVNSLSEDDYRLYKKYKRLHLFTMLAFIPGIIILTAIVIKFQLSTDDPITYAGAFILVIILWAINAPLEKKCRDILREKFYV